MKRMALGLAAGVCAAVLGTAAPTKAASGSGGWLALGMALLLAGAGLRRRSAA